jgi:hypothetical protein
VPVRTGLRGNPALIGRDLFDAIKRLEGDRGARPLLEAAGKDVGQKIDMPLFGAPTALQRLFHSFSMVSSAPFTAQAGRPERCAKSSSASRLLSGSLEASAVRTKEG